MFALGEYVYNFCNETAQRIPGCERAHFVLNTESNMSYVAESVAAFVQQRQGMTLADAMSPSSTSTPTTTAAAAAATTVGNGGNGNARHRPSGGVTISCFTTTTAAGGVRVGALTTNASKVAQANTMSRLLIHQSICFHGKFDETTEAHRKKPMRTYLIEQLHNYGRRETQTHVNSVNGPRVTTTFGPIDEDIKDDAVMALGILTTQLEDIHRLPQYAPLRAVAVPLESCQ